MFKITFLSERTADCFLVSVGSPQSATHILIDGGLAKDKNKLVDHLKAHTDAGNTLDLVILSHVDGDHIGGLLGLFQQDFINSTFVKEVWFNSKISTLTKSSKDLDISYTQGNKLAKLLEEKKINTRGVCSDTNEPQFSSTNCEITVLAPSQVALDKLEDDWRSLEVSAENVDLQLSWDELRQEPFVEDQSVTNRSSIAVVIRSLLSGRSVFFAGDSVPSEILARVDTTPKKFELVKLPHHGSKKNINVDLIEKFPAKRYVIPAGANNHKPHKKTMQVLLESSVAPFDVYLPRGNWVTLHLVDDLSKHDCTIIEYSTGQSIEI